MAYVIYEELKFDASTNLAFFRLLDAGARNHRIQRSTKRNDRVRCRGSVGSATRAVAGGHRPRNTVQRNMALGVAFTVVALLGTSSTYANPADAAADSEQLVEIP